MSDEEKVSLLMLATLWAGLWLAVRDQAWRVAWVLAGLHGALAWFAVRDLVGDALWWLAIDVAGLWLVMKPRKVGDADV